jgi:hypothetical protein
MAIFRAQLPPWPLSRRAVDPRIGEAAAGAVEMAIATAA